MRERLFVLGASGGTGRAVVEQALGRGQRVTAFVRSPQKLGTVRPGLTVIQGDPRDARALRAALPGHDAVVSALGPPGTAPSTILSEAAQSTTRAMGEAGVRRLLIVSAGVLFDQGFFTALLRGTFLRHVARDSLAMERAVMASDLDYTVVRAPRLTNGALTGRYCVAVERMPARNGSPALAALSRQDLADFLLEELDRNAHVRRLVGVAAR